jgi:glycosyltransferase involved in cell wall biosynthesis
LIGLYSACEVFVFPSWIEGFGLPALEAMACGAPLIASNRGSLPEVVGNAGVLIDPEDPQSLADELGRVLSAPSEARSLRRLGLARAADFSWERTARQILASYEVVAGRVEELVS